MNDDPEVSSTASWLSQMSVDFQGQTDIPLEQALDEVFTQLQQYINGTHCYTREFVAMFDQDNEYTEEFKKMLEIYENIDGVADLFAELKSVLKQCLGKPTAEEKASAKKLLDAYKEKKKKVKPTA